MKDADETIERLLAGLRDAEPPAGIERRILEALGGMDAREASSSASLWSRPLRPAIALLLACAVMLMVAIAFQQHRRDVRNRSASATVPQATRPEVVAQKAPAVPRRLVSRVSARRPHDRPALRETQTASFPAPPLPLTGQERLLLRIAHRGDAENMALLIPDVQAAQIAEAAEQFQHFFAIDAREMRSQSE